MNDAMTELHVRMAVGPTVVIDPFTAPEATHSLGAAPLRSRAIVRGSVDAIEPVTWAGGPVLEVTLGDGADRIVLVFLGRHALGGVEPGQQLTAAGTIGTHRGRRVILNPIVWLTNHQPATPVAATAAVADLSRLATVSPN
jgi:hypothetical protein